MTRARQKTRHVMRWIMAAFYLFAGVGHLLRPDAFLPIVPDWVPFPPTELPNMGRFYWRD